MAERVPLTSALSMAQAAPAFRASMLASVQLASSLSLSPAPSLTPLTAALPTAADPWRAESAKLVAALVAQPAVLSAHQAELRAALGEAGADALTTAAARIQAGAAAGGPLAGEVAALRSGLDLNDASAVDALGSRLNSLFEASKQHPGSSPAVQAGTGGTRKPMVTLSRQGEAPALSHAELEAHVAKNAVVSPRGFKRVNFRLGRVSPGVRRGPASARSVISPRRCCLQARPRWPGTSEATTPTRSASPRGSTWSKSR